MRTRLTTIIIVLPLLVTLIACGSSTPQNAKVRLAYLQNDLHHLPAFIALEKGLFQQRGIAVEVAGMFRAGPELMTGFAAGDLDLGYVGLAPAMVAVANHTAQVKVIAQVNKNGSALVVGKDAPLSTLTDLKGKVIAIPGHSTIQDFLLRKALSLADLESSSLTIITIKPPEMLSVLRSAQIDAFIAWEPYPAKAVTTGIGKILTSSKDIWQDHPCCVLIASTSFIEQHRSIVNDLLNVHLQSIQYIATHGEEAVSIGVKYTGMDRETIERALQNIQFDHSLSAHQAAEYSDFLADLGYAPRADSKTFIQSLMVEAQK